MDTVMLGLLNKCSGLLLLIIAAGVWSCRRWLQKMHKNLEKMHADLDCLHDDYDIVTEAHARSKHEFQVRMDNEISAHMNKSQKTPKT